MSYIPAACVYLSLQAHEFKITPPIPEKVILPIRVIHIRGELAYPTYGRNPFDYYVFLKHVCNAV